MLRDFNRFGALVCASLVGLLLLATGVWAQSGPDSDGDGLPDYCDNCTEVANGTLLAPGEDGNSPLDTDADGYGNACDCDFDQNGTCNIDDFSIFRSDFQSTVDSGVGTDMDGSGSVGIDDFSLFRTGFQTGTPGPGPSSAGVLHPLLPFTEGQCWDDRVGLPRPLRSAGGSSDGCSLAPADLAAVDLTLFGLPQFPLDGDVNNPTDHMVRTQSGGLVGCPNAAFGSFRKAGLTNSDLCGIDVPSVVCGAERTGLPCLGSKIADESPSVCSPDKMISCLSNADCPAGLSCFQGDAGGVCNPTTPLACDAAEDCETGLGALVDPSDAGNDWKCHPMNCGDALNGFACESHDSCGALCGYRKFQCDDEFRDHLFATCYALEGQEADLCKDLCLVFAELYANDKDPILQDDDGTWMATDIQEQGDKCRCCTNLVFDLDLPSTPIQYATAICGDGICDPSGAESCLLRSCPQDCGPCTEGDYCASDADCPDLSCFRGRCGKLPAQAPCEQDSQCRSGDCGLLGACVSRCGDDFCDGSEQCGGDDFLLECNSDCGKCSAGRFCLSNNDCLSDICNLGFCVSAGTLSNGDICTNNDACESGICNAGICIASPLPVGLPCTTDGACVSDTCVGVCIQRCGDDSCDGTERCGGADSGLACYTDCGTCSNGQVCAVDADCTSGLCSVGFCVATGLPNGSVCISNGQCTSGLCNSGFCTAPGGVGNGGICTSNNACQSGICNAGLCIAGPLNAGAVCTTDLACFSGSCIGVCAQACGDSQCDGTELCGGSNSGLACNTDCGRCPNGGACTQGTDCLSGFCAALICANPPPSCGDGSCNGVEVCGNSNSGLECNQDCGLCSNGTLCTSSNDCSSGFCAGTCQNPPSCTPNGGSCSAETDCCSARCDGTGSGRTCRACKSAGGSCNELNDCCSLVCNFFTDKCL